MVEKSNERGVGRCKGDGASLHGSLSKYHVFLSGITHRTTCGKLLPTLYPSL